MYGYDGEAMEANRRAQEARRRALLARGMMSEEVTFPCALAPGTDSVKVMRSGATGDPTALIVLGVQSGQGGPAHAMLSPANARALAGRLLEHADEVDGLETEFSLRMTAGDMDMLSGD